MPDELCSHCQMKPADISMRPKNTMVDNGEVWTTSEKKNVCCKCGIQLLQAYRLAPLYAMERRQHHD